MNVENILSSLVTQEFKMYQNEAMATIFSNKFIAVTNINKSVICLKNGSEYVSLLTTVNHTMKYFRST